FPEALNGLGLVLQEQGDFPAAIASFEAALRHKPDCADAHANLGAVYAELGDMTKSNSLYREALRADPDHASALAVRATQLRDKLPEADVASLRRFLARARLPDQKCAALHHALAHVLDARGEYTQAAEHAAKGNTHRKAAWARQGKTYSRAEHSGFVS